MKRTALLFLFTFTGLALTFIPEARLKVSTTSGPTFKTTAPVVLEAAPAFIAPTVSLTSPANNASFIAGSTIQLRANASDSDGSVSKVEFFQGATKLGEDTSAPYSFDWTNVLAGTYSLTARATDNANETATSSPVAITVTSQSKQYVGWTAITNGTDLGNGTVRKTSTGSWDFSAVAAQQLLPGDGFIESTAASSVNQSIALNAPDGQSRYLIVGTGTWVGIYENNVEVAATCCRAPNETIPVHAAGDRYRLEINNGKLLYVRYRAGARTLMFTSNAALPTYPFSFSLHSSLQNAEWQNSVIAQLTRKATWSSISNGIDLGNGTVRKTSAGVWDFGAVTAQQLLPGDSYIESTAASSINQSIALNAPDGQSRYVIVGTGTWVGIYENNVEVAATCCRAPNETIPVHAAGDRYRLEISEGKLLYVRYRAGVRTVMFTSNAALPTYPFSFSLHASPQNAEWQNSVVAQLTTNATWSSITNGIDLGNGTLRKTSTGTWDFSAVARQQLVSGNGYFESTASYYNQSIVLGATDGQYRYIVVGTGGWASLNENGVEVASTCCRAPSETIPPHLPGDRYRLEVSRGKLRYVRYRSGVRSVIFTSPNVLPPYPYGFSLGASFQNSEWQNTIFRDNVPDHNDAVFVSQTMATTLSPGQSTNATVTMRNTGSSTWTPDGDYQLASENLSDNQTWGLSRVNLTSVVPPGSDAVFNFTVTAPSTPGAYNFQWRMVQQNVQRFGALSTNVTVTTVNGPPTVTLTGPNHNASFNTGSTITLTATASDSDGTISKVEFFQGATKLGEDTTFPYSFSWTNVAAGNYQLTARATDNGGAIATSNSIDITVVTPNQPPSVSLTNPHSNDVFSAPANITLTALASDPDGIVTKVQFFQGSTLLNEDLSEPFSFTWTNVGAGSYNLTAKAFDNAGASTPSAGVGITVNAVPAVSLTAPTSGQVFTAPASITLTATASDSDGSISKVQFFQGTTLLNEDLSPPYNFAWNDVSAGSYSLTAKAIDNLGGTTTSAAIPITVNTLPTVSITSPAPATTFAAPANIAITASAFDSDGSISKVEFFAGASLLGEDTTPPYEFFYNNVSSGTYLLTARATDNLGGVTASTAVTAFVTNAPSTSITSPANNAGLVAGSNILISASASDSDGTVAKVEFFKDGVLLGEDATVPYSFTWNNVPAGSFALTTRVTDNLGVTGSSGAVNIHVLIATAVARLDPMNRTGGGIEDPLSRNYNWNVPLLNLPGRAGLSLGLSLSYNSLVWTRSGNHISFDDDAGFPGPGFRLGFPVIQEEYFNPEVGKNAFLLITQDGSRVELRQVASSSSYEAADSSHLLLNRDTMVLRTSDGTQMKYVWKMSAFQCTEVKDRNGNFITINRDAAGRITTIVDTVGRAITFNYNAADGHSLTSITQAWAGQPEHVWASFTYSSPEIRTNFINVTKVGRVNGSTIKALRSVTINDGSRFEFDYTSWGQVNKISKFAADGHPLNYRSYNLPPDELTELQDCPRFSERRDWAENWNRSDATIGKSGLPAGLEGEVLTATWTGPDDGSWTMPDDTSHTGKITQMTAVDGTYVKMFFGGQPDMDAGWQRGLITLIETYGRSTPNDPIIKQKSVATKWTQDNTGVAYLRNPRVEETNIYDYNASGQVLNRARTRFAYETITLGSMSYRLPSDVFEYQSDPEKVLRRTHTEYNSNSDYTDRHILGLVSHKWLYETLPDNVEKVMAHTEFLYDQAQSIVGDDAPVQHDPAYHAGIVGRANLTTVKRHDVKNDGEFTAIKTKFNTAGAPVVRIDAEGHEQLISYADSYSDGNNSRNTLAYATSVTNADNFTSTVQYRFDLGAVARTVSPAPELQSAGAIRNYSYDSKGRLQKVAVEFGTNADFTHTRFEYLENQTRINTFVTVKPGSPEAQSFKIVDGHGRVIASASQHPTSAEGFSAQLMLFDKLGQMIKSSNPAETDVDGTPVEWEALGDDEITGWVYTQQTYDWNGRAILITNPSMTSNPAHTTTQQISYSGCGCAGGEVVTLTDEMGRRQKIYNDILGRSVKTEILNWDGTVYSATVNSYDARDLITKTTQYKGAEGSLTSQITTMVYDGYGRLESQHDPEQSVGTSTTWTYNDDDTVDTITDARGASQTFDYNNRHLPISIIYDAPDGSGISEPAQVTFGYDAAGNRISMTDGLGSQSYKYDQLSRLSEETRNFSVGSFTIHYAYNLIGQLTGVTDPFGATFSYTRNLQGQLTAVTGSPFGSSGFTNYVTDVQYRAWGAPRSVTYNTTNATIEYNGRMLPKAYRVTSISTGNSVMRENYGYWHDRRLATLTDLDDTGGNNPPSTLRFLSRGYEYDHVGRITSGFGNGSGGHAVPFAQGYSYDEFGNMTSRGGSYYNYMNQQPSTIDNATYVNNRRTGWSYNANGQVLSNPASTANLARSITYDAAGNLIHTVETDSSITRTYSASYDGNGDVVFETNTKTFSPSESAYAVRSTVLDGEVLTRLDQSGNKKITHVPTFGLLIAKQVIDQGFSTVQLSLLNPQRNTESGRLVHDPLGNVIPFQSFGDPRPPAGSYSSASLSGLSVSLANPHSYGNGCLLDGSPVNCSLAMRLRNNGSAERCPENDCGPRMVDGKLRPISLIEQGFAAWVDKKKNPPRLKTALPHERAGRKKFKKERGDNPYNVGADENAKFNIGVIRTLVTTTLLERKCRDFYVTVLRAVSTKDNPVLENGDLLSIFEKFLIEGSFTREAPDGLSGPANGAADGLIEGKQRAEIYINDQAGDRNFSDAYFTIGELFHLSGSKALYYDKDLADAVHNGPYKSFESILSPAANIYSPQYQRPENESKESAYSYYFHTIHQHICVMRPTAGFGGLH